MTFFVDRVVSDLVLLTLEGVQDYVQATVAKVCEGIASGRSAGVATAKILKSQLLFYRPYLVYADGSRRPMRDLLPRDYYPVFLVMGESSLCSGEIAELFAANPGEFEVTGPAGERIRATTIDSLTFSPANISTAEPPKVTAELNFSSSDEVEWVSFGRVLRDDSFSSSLYTRTAVGAARAGKQAKS